MAAAKKNAKAPKKPSGQASAGMSKPVKKQAPGQVQEGKVFISEADEYLFAQEHTMIFIRSWAPTHRWRMV